MKPYGSYTPSGIPWLTRIPSHWETRKAKRLVHKMDRAPRTDDKVVTCFRDGQVTLRENRRTEGFTESLQEIGYQGIRTGDLVVHSMDAFAGAVGVSDSDGKATPVYSVCTMAHCADAFYYAHIIREMARSQWIAALATGIRERSTDFRYTALAEQSLPVPPAEEQAAIVHYLDHADELINRYISAKERLIALLREQRQTAIHQAVTRGLDLSVPLKQTEIPWAEELPHDWQTAHLRYITTCLDGARRPVSAELRANMQGGIPYWGANSVIDHVNDWLFDEPLVLVGEDGAPFFEPYRDVSFFVHGRIWPNNHIHVLRCTTHVSPRFLTHVLNCVDYTNYISGSTRDKLTQQALGSIPIQLPPLEVQDSIVDFLDRALNTIDSTISSASRQISLMNEYRTRLIADVVTGQLDVRDAAIRIPD